MTTSSGNITFAPTDMARKRVFFDPTINLGHVLTFVGFLVTGFSAYTTLDKRVTVIENRAAIGDEHGKEQAMRIKESMGEVRIELRELQRTVNEVNRTVNLKTSK